MAVLILINHNFQKALSNSKCSGQLPAQGDKNEYGKVKTIGRTFFDRSKSCQISK